MATVRPRHNRRHNGSRVSEQERIARKREQNRIAQQVYRRTQKERIQALEAAVAAQSSAGGGPSWPQFEGVPGTDLFFSDGTAVMTTPLDSETLAADSTNFTTTLFPPLLDSNLDPGLTRSLSAGPAGSPAVVLGDYSQQDGHNTATTTIAAATTASATIPSISFGQHDEHIYEAYSAPALAFASTQDDDTSVLHTSSQPDGAAIAASSTDITEQVAAWSHSMKAPTMDTCDGSEAGDHRANHGLPPPQGMSPAQSTALLLQHRHYAQSASPQPPPASPGRHYNGSRRTALHIAASQGDSCLVQLLLERGADAGAVDEDGRTPLHLAVIAAAGAAAEAKRCVDSGGRSTSTSTSTSNIDGDSGCDIGGGGGEAKVAAEKTLHLLLGAQGADFCIRDNVGRSVLFTAVAAGSEAVVQTVLDAMDGESSLANSSSSTSGVAGSKTAVFAAGRAGIQAALNEPDARGTMPLHLAVASGSASIVLLLLSYGANVNA